MLPKNSKVHKGSSGSTESDANVFEIKYSFDQMKTNTYGNKNYKMDHPRRGKAIIFNHYRYKKCYPEREGTKFDVKNLTKALLYLGFTLEDIDIHEDLSAANIADELKKVQQEDHTDKDLLMIFVLTHGSQNDRISAYDVEYPVESLWEPFRADKCETLAGKPKIFFVIACRGELVDYGLKIHTPPDICRQSKTVVDARPIEFENYYSIPVWSDFLYVFSTYKGFLSYRNTEVGTWYIQAFCEELTKTNIGEISFTDFLIAVNGRLARGFQKETFLETRKQISSFNSTLTKCLYFKTNKNQFQKRSHDYEY